MHKKYFCILPVKNNNTFRRTWRRILMPDVTWPTQELSTCDWITWEALWQPWTELCKQQLSFSNRTYRQLSITCLLTEGWNPHENMKWAPNQLVDLSWMLIQCGILYAHPYFPTDTDVFEYVCPGRGKWPNHRKRNGWRKMMAFNNFFHQL